MSFDIIVKSLSAIGISAVAITSTAILVVIFLNPEKVFIWKGAFQRLFSGIVHSFKKKSIANEIRGGILEATKRLSKDNLELFPYDLKIEWVDSEEVETFFSENQVIVRMGNDSNPCKNYVVALMAYVESGVIPKSRRYVEKKLLEASDLTIMRKLFVLTWDKALDYFDREICDPRRSCDRQLNKYMEELRVIDGAGMYIPVFLNELKKTANLIYPDDSNEVLLQESKEFLLFLYSIATRNNGDLTELQFNKSYYKIGIVLAVSDTTYRFRGIDYYKNKLQFMLDKGIESVYILGLGQKREAVKELGECVKEKDLRIKEVLYHPYVHRRSNGYSEKKGVCAEIVLWQEEDMRDLKMIN